MKSKKVLVVGAGVNGLSCAVLLAENGYDTSVWAKDLPFDTTSNIAAAYWYPYLCNPRDKALEWTKRTYKYLNDYVIDDPESGVFFVTGIDYFKEETPDPWWRSAVEEFDRLPKEELPDGYTDSYRSKGIVMDTSKYLPWLVRKLEQNDIKIMKKSLTSFDSALSEFDVVVNCTGLGARELCNDNDVFPVKGQVVRVEAHNFKSVLGDETGENPTYIIPRTNDVILGGIARPNDWSLSADDHDTEDILSRVKKISSDFANPKILEVKVGLRPARNEIRLEAETRDEKLLVHNYGHGGAGFTLSWGCAQDVVSLINSH